MTPRLARRVVIGLFGALSVIGANAANADPVLYSIGPDGTGVGRVLTPIVPSATGVALGDGSTAFDGGLAYRSSDNSLFAIANDSYGQSSLLTVDPASGAITTVGAIGTGFSGGLAIDGTNTLHAIGSDFTGLSGFYSLDATSGAATYLGTLGFGFSGLAFDTEDQSFYAFAGDAFGVPDQFERIDLTGGVATATTLFSFADAAFNGGLVYDPVNDDFLAIGNDPFGNSTLYSLNNQSADSLTIVRSLGGGYVNASLAFVDATTAPSPGTVPEPSTPLLLAGAVLVFGRRRRIPHCRFTLSRRAS